MKPEHRHPLRRDRSKDEAWIRSFLNRGAVCVLTTVREGRPHPVPLLYAYDEDREAVYLHTGKRGRSRENVEVGTSEAAGLAEDGERGGSTGPSGLGAPAALSVFEMGRLLPAEEAAEFGLEYASVQVSGRSTVVDDPGEAQHGLRLLMEKYAPHLKAGKDYRSITEGEIARTTVLRVDIEEWSGKEKVEASDYPAAYLFEEVRKVGEPGG